MTLFTNEEQHLICRYDPGSRDGLIYEMRKKLKSYKNRKSGLGAVVQSLLEKLGQMTDEEYFEEAVALAPFYKYEEKSHCKKKNHRPFVWSDNPEVDDYDLYDDFN